MLNQAQIPQIGSMLIWNDSFERRRRALTRSKLRLHLVQRHRPASQHLTLVLQHGILSFTAFCISIQTKTNALRKAIPPPNFFNTFSSLQGQLPRRACELCRFWFFSRFQQSLRRHLRKEKEAASQKRRAELNAKMLQDLKYKQSVR